MKIVGKLLSLEANLPWNLCVLNSQLIRKRLEKMLLAACIHQNHCSIQMAFKAAFFFYFPHIYFMAPICSTKPAREAGNKNNWIIKMARNFRSFTATLNDEHPASNSSTINFDQVNLHLKFDEFMFQKLLRCCQINVKLASNNVQYFNYITTDIKLVKIFFLIAAVS